MRFIGAFQGTGLPAVFVAMSYPRDFNPKEELKKKAENYASMIRYGLPFQKLNEYEQPPDDAHSKLAAEMAGKSLWDLWARGKLYQFYIMQWALRDSATNEELKSLVKFVLRVTHLAELNSDAAAAVAADCKAADAAKAALPAVFAATRKTPFDVPAFQSSIKPLLDAVRLAEADARPSLAFRTLARCTTQAPHASLPINQGAPLTRCVRVVLQMPGAATTCDTFLGEEVWAKNLTRATFIVNQPKVCEPRGA